MSRKYPNPTKKFTRTQGKSGQAEEQKPVMGRPPKEINDANLKFLMRFKPSMQDCACYFDCDLSTIQRFINQKYNMTFTQFRDKYLGQTRLILQQKAIYKAMKGDNWMLTLALKNLSGWSDSPNPDEFKEPVEDLEFVDDQEIA